MLVQHMVITEYPELLLSGVPGSDSKEDLVVEEL